MELAEPLGIFSLTAVVIVVAAIVLAISSDVIAERSGWGRLWVGSLLMAGATSLPELVTNIAAVRIGAPALAAGDILGSNMLNMSNLALLASGLGGGALFRRLMPQQALVALLAMALTGIATLSAALQIEVRWLFLSPPSLAILVGYGVGSRILYRMTPQATEEEISTEGHSLRWGWTMFLLSAAAISGSAPFLATSAQSIATVTGLGEGFVGVVAVAFVTTLPELVATGTAIRQGADDLAVAGMFGTNAFNVGALAVADMFSPGESLFGSLDGSHVAAGLFAILLMGIAALQVRRRRRLPWFSVKEPSTTLMVGLYALGLATVYRRG